MMVQAARIYLAVAVGAQGRYADALVPADAAIAEAERTGDAVRLAAYATVRLWLCAGLGDWAGFDASLPRLEALAASGWVDGDMAWCLSEATALAESASQPDRAAIAGAAAEAQWRGLGRAPPPRHGNSTAPG